MFKKERKRKEKKTGKIVCSGECAVKDKKQKCDVANLNAFTQLIKLTFHFFPHFLQFSFLSFEMKIRRQTNLDKIFRN